MNRLLCALLLALIAIGAPARAQEPVVQAFKPDEQGLASKVTTAALQDIRDNGWRVHPICPFTVSFLDNQPEYADLRV